MESQQRRGELWRGSHGGRGLDHPGTRHLPRPALRRGTARKITHSFLIPSGGGGDGSGGSGWLEGWGRLVWWMMCVAAVEVADH